VPDAAPTLAERLPSLATSDDAFLAFLDHAASRGLTLYPAQEEAILALYADRHVILATPTGSGKSLVAAALHVRGVVLGKRCWYTAPIKALASEKFFELCREFGAARVGLMTGDASIHREAPIVCCTAEVLAQMVLSEGAEAPVDCVVMDEFHYYADRDRGMAWQIPLLGLPHAQFLLMSATLGDTTAIEEGLQARTGRRVDVVTSVTRPVPLHFDYRETPLHETIADYLKSGRSPVYLVHSSQREAAESAQALMSLDVCTKEEKRTLSEALSGQRWSSPYGKDLQRYLRHGIGIHHAGLLPRYRLLVEQLAQRGLLKVICGTDTLGVGINVPLRSVVLTKLCKFDGENSRILSVREFQQIAGRAGRKGFDTEGWVSVQAPEHIINNKRMELKTDSRGKPKSFVRQKPPDKGYIPWGKDTFDKLVNGRPEALQSVFRIDQGMILSMLRRREDDWRPGGGLRALCELIGRSHERPAAKLALRSELARLFRALRAAGVIDIVPRDDRWGSDAVVAQGLQRDFSLHHTLSLWLIDTLDHLDPDRETWVLDVVTLCESIIDNPMPVLRAQVSREKALLIADLKADGVPYEERMAELERVTWPKPMADWIYDRFEIFTTKHPWLEHETIRPKSVVREMAERYCSFDEYIREYGLQATEGVLLRYLTQVYKTLVQNVPELLHTDELVDLIGWLRATLARVDSSLVEAWERLHGGVATAVEELEVKVRPLDLTRDKRAFQARLRAEMHRLVAALAARDFAEATASVRFDDEYHWPPERWESMLAAFEVEHGPLIFNHAARLADKTRIAATQRGVWEVTQALCSRDGETGWHIAAVVDLSGDSVPEGPLVAVTSAGEGNG